MSPDHKKPEDLLVEGQTEIVRDFVVEESSEWKSVSGVAMEKSPAGERPIPAARIESLPVGRGGRASLTIADAKGQFQLSVKARVDFVIYARDAKGTIAGFTSIAADAKDVRAFASEAARIFGKVRDSEGKAIAGKQVTLQLQSGASFQTSARFRQQSLTDSAGNYEFRGAVVDARAEVSVRIGEEDSLHFRSERTVVRGPDPIAMPDIQVPPAAAKTGERPRSVPVIATGEFRPVAPTRLAIETLLREIGRGPVTGELVDRTWLLTRPQFQWFASIDEILRDHC